MLESAMPTSHVSHSFLRDLLALLLMLLPLPLEQQLIWQDENGCHALETLGHELLQLSLAGIWHAAAACAQMRSDLVHGKM